jgi:predicted glutamine amidotransferase
MCGIFGQISKSCVNKNNLVTLVKHSEQRGIDSSGLIYLEKFTYKVAKADYNIHKLLRKVHPYTSNIVLGHSRLITNGLTDNQPVVRGNMAVIHNGIVVNCDEVWEEIGLERQYKIDSEAILGVVEKHLADGGELDGVVQKILSTCKGTIACALMMPDYGKLLLFSNNGSLYSGNIDDDIYFASESYALNLIGCDNIEQIKGDSGKFIDIPNGDKKLVVSNDSQRVEDLIPEFKFNKNEEGMLEYADVEVQRCTKCVLPATMPFIRFDEEGVCNYCHNYKMRNNPKPKEELFQLVEPYRRPGDELDCIVPFSGGRDSCYGLHLIVNELKMKPITYTYDWGMVTDIGRRNISRMCAELGVENIIVAADISKKRRNIRMNLEAWLKAPHLGMMALLTAGDKHFFRHVETIKKQTGININLWGVNPLEVTHFKAGFLGIKPDFEEDKVYSNGAMKQVRYHAKRFKAMCESFGYFNRSLWDTLSGEYYRSFTI